MKRYRQAATRWPALSLALAMGVVTGAPSGAQAVTDAESLVPVRSVGDALGAEIKWDGETATVTVQKGSHSLAFRIGAADVTANGQKVKLTAPIRVDAGRALLPLRVINEALGTDAAWDEAKQLVRSGDLTGFAPQPVLHESKSAYDISLQMHEKGTFTATAKIDVENLSADQWDKLMFYFIPHAYNEPDDVIDVFTDPVRATIQQLTVNGQKAAYALAKDQLEVKLPDGLDQGDKVQVLVTWTFNLPTTGVRYYETNGRYYLAQWYPMLCTYNKEQGGWNKSPYSEGAETYTTAHSDFQISYQLPPGYTLASTAENDPEPGTMSGRLTAKNVKEVFIAIGKEMKMKKQRVDGVEVRAFTRESHAELLDEVLKTATSAVAYYSKTIGRYPMQQLDVVIDSLKAGGMEYPGIVTSVPADGTRLKHIIAHEVAHQWFYGMVSNDTFHDGWLDEGLTEFATCLYMYQQEQMTEEEAFGFARAFVGPLGPDPKPSNLPVTDYLKNNETGPYLYGQPALQLWDLFKRYGGAEEASRFLRAYWETYKYKQVDTEEWLRFATAYYPIDEAFFGSWLKIN